MIDIDVIGNIEGAEGWHVNVTPDGLTKFPQLASFVVHPDSMARVWAGDDPENPVLTVALRFETEAEFAGVYESLNPVVDLETLYEEAAS